MNGVLMALATTACLASALFVYGASPNCRLRGLRFGRPGMGIGLALIVAGAVLWSLALGMGTGLVVALATWMLGLIVLPYLAWHLAPADTRAGKR